MNSDKDLNFERAGAEARIVVDALRQTVPGTEIVAIVTDIAVPIPGFELDPVVGDEATAAFEAIRTRVFDQLKGEDDDVLVSFVTKVHGIEWGVLVNPITLENERVIGALIIARQGRVWSKRERDIAASYAGLLSHVATAANQAKALQRQRVLDELVNKVAERLMSASAVNRQETLDWVMWFLADFLKADVAFMRRNDLHHNVSILEAEWPIRTDKPDPDPLYEIAFDADPIFMQTRDLREPYLNGGIDMDEVYKDRAIEGSGVYPSDGACVPLLLGDVTWGIVGFLHLDKHNWIPAEVRALTAVASLLVQMQARIDAEERTRYNADHDDLTGLPNRRALIEELKLRIAQRRRFAAMVIDLDRFKVMNDYLGHANGDKLLIAMADRLRNGMGIRATDFVARLGGDEFVVLLDNARDSVQVQATGLRIREAIAKPMDINGQEVSHTASLGIAFSDGDKNTALDYLRWADVAMYEAKTRGGNQTIIFDQELRKLVDERSQTELELREAIEGDGLRLHYQPEVDIRTGQLLSVESLVRWQHPVRGLLNAADFIRIAEETGIVTDMGRWVFNEACRQLALWQRDYPNLDFKVRVNMSPADFRQPKLVEKFSEVIERHGVSGNRLCIEITEYATLDDFTYERITSVIAAFQEMGVEIALDDFGTGTASMTELKKLPVDILKLDMSFVRGVATDTRDRTIVESLISLGDGFNLGITAEGIETATIAEKLMEMWCFRGQGYLFSRPVPAESLTAILNAGAIESEFLAPAGSSRGE
jgi:diguanylate cyclase (GGDEF)-like protein